MLDFTIQPRLLSRLGWGLFASASLLFASACSPDCKDDEREVDGECVAEVPGDRPDVKDRISIELDSNSANGIADNGKIDFNIAREYEITATVAGKNEDFESSLEGLPIVFSYDGQAAIFTGTNTRTVATDANGVATLRVTSNTDERNRIISVLFEGDDAIAKATVTAAVNFCGNCETTSPVVDTGTDTGGPTNEAAQAAIRGFAFEGPFLVGEGETAILILEAFDDAGAVLPGVDVYISVNDPLQLKTALDPVKGPNGLATTDSDGRIRISVTPRQGASGAQTILAQALRPDGSSATATRIITISSNRAPTNILFTAAPLVIQPTNANEVALEAIVLDDLGHPMPAAQVTFEITAGPGLDKSTWGYVEELATQEGAEGATATYFAGTATGTVTIQVSTVGAAGALITKTVDITVSTSAPASVTNSAEDQAQDILQLQTAMLAIQPDATIISSDGLSQIGIDVKPLGSGNQALENVIVQFSISGGSMPADQRGSITPAQQKSNASGITSLIYTAGTVAGTVTIQAEVRLKTTNALITSNSVVLTLTSDPIEVQQVTSIIALTSSLTVEPQSLDPVRITAYPLNANGLLIDGDYVTFTLVTAGAGRLEDGGDNQVDYYPSSLTGIVQIQACAGSVLCTTVQVDVQPDSGLGDVAAQDAIQQSAAYLNLTAVGSAVVLSGTGNSLVLNAQVMDASNGVVRDAIVTYSLTAGPTGNRADWGAVDVQSRTGADGVAEAVYYSASVTGTVTVEATVRSVPSGAVLLSDTLVVQVDAATNAADQAQDLIQQQTVMLDIQPVTTFVQSDGSSQIDILVKPIGSANQTLADVIVDFSISAGSMAAAQRGSITPGQAVSNAAGATTLLYTAGTVAGSVTVQAEVRLKTTGAVLVSNSVVLTLVSQPIEVLQVASISGVASVLTLVPQSPDPALITAYPLNADGLLIEGDFVTFSLLTAGDAGRLVDIGANEVEYYAGTVTGLIDVQLCAGLLCDTVQIVVQPDTGLGDLTAQEAIQQSSAYLNLTSVGPAAVLSGPSNTLLLNAQVMSSTNGVVRDAIVTYSLTAGPTGNRADWGAIDVQSRTGSDGIAEAVYYGAVVTGFVTVEATVRSVVSGAVLLTDTLVVQVDAAQSSDQTAEVTALILTSNRISVKPGFANTVAISAQALNATNNPLTELFVYFDLETGPTGDRGEWGSILSRGEPDAQGVASTTYYAGTATGDVWVRARAGTVTEYLKLTIDVNAGDITGPGGSSVEQEARQSNVAALVLMADNDNLPLGPSHSTQIHVWPIGSDNTPQPNVIVSFSVVTGPTLVAQSDWGMIDGNATTGADGKASVTYLAGNFAGPVTVRAQAKSVLDATIYADAYYTLNLQSAQSDAEARTQTLHLVAEPATVEQNSAEPIVIRGIALDSNNALIEGDFIEFALIEPGTPAQVGYIAKGSEDNTILYYPGSQTGGITLEARANGLTQTIDAFVVVPAVISPDALQASVTRLILTKSAPSVDQGPTNTMDILAWAVNANNNPLTGVKVNFAVISGPTGDPANWGGVEQEASTTNGLATAEYFAGFETGTVTIRAWVARITDSSVITQTTVDVPVVAAEVADETPYVDSIILRLGQTEVQPGFSNSVDVEAMVLNALGNPLNNVTVDFRLVAGPAGPQSGWGAIQTSINPTGGIAKTKYFAGATTGAVTIEASIGGVSTQAVITVSNAAVTADNTNSIAQEALQSAVSALVVTLDKSSLNLGPTNTAKVSVFPIGSDSTPVLGAKVGFTIVSATSGTRPQWGVIEGSATTTNGSGSVNYYAGTTDATVTLRAFVRSVTDSNVIYAQQDVTIDLVDPLPAQATVVDIALSLEEGMVLPGVQNKIKVWAQPINAFGNPVEDIPVTFALISGPTGSVVDWGSIEGSASSTGGVAEVLYTAGSVTGAVEIQASVGGVIVSTFVNIVLQLPEDNTDIQVQEARQRAAAFIALSADPALITVPGTEFSTLEAFVLTSNNNLLEGVTVDFRVAGSTFLSQSDWGGITAQGETNTSGVTQVFYVPADVSLAGTVTIEASVRSVTNPSEILLTQTMLLTVQPDQDDSAAVASLAFFASGLVIEPGDSLDLNAVAMDVNNNPLRNLSVAFAVTGGTALNPEDWGFVGALATPGADGIATTTFQASQTTGYVWVDATVGVVTRTLQIQIAGPAVLDDTASVASIILAAASTEVAPGLGNPLQLSAMAVDAQGRPLRNVLFDFEILNATAVSGAVDFSGVPSSADGIATATYRAGNALGPVAIRATVGAITAQLSILVTDTPAQEPVDDATQQAVQTVVVLASPSTFVLGQDTSSDISVLTLGANNVALDGVVVDLAITAGPGSNDNWGLIESRAVSADGVASASYRLPQLTGAVTIEAYVRSVTDFSLIATSFTTINVVNPTVAVDDTPLVVNLILAASAGEVAPGLGNTVAISAMAVDAQGSPLRDLVIDFEILSPTAVSGAIDGGTGVPGASGIAQATYYAGSLLGPIAIRATVGAVSAQLSVLVTNDPNPEPIDDAQQQAVQTVVVLASPSTFILGTDTESTIEVLTLGANNTALDNVVVDLAITGGPGTNDLWGFVDGRIESTNGVATATYQSPLATGVVTIEAYVRSVTDFSLVATGFTTITVSNSPVVLDDSGLVANLILTSNKTEVAPGLENVVGFSAMAVDAQGQPLRNLSIMYEILSPTAVSGAIDGGTGIPGANGIANATYYAGTATGIVTIRASVGAATATRNILVTNTPNPAATLDDSTQQAIQSLVVVANPAQVDVGVDGETEIRILTLGVDNVALDGVIVDLAITNGPGSSANWGLIAGSATSNDGVAAVNYGSALQTGTVTIEAYVRSITDFSLLTTGFTTVNVVDPNAPVADDSALVTNLILVSDKTEIQPGLSNIATLSAMAVDAQGQPLRNLAINFEILSPTVVSGAVDSVNSGKPGTNGIATAKYYAGSATGTVTLRASVGALSQTLNILITNSPNVNPVDNTIQNSVAYLVLASDVASLEPDSFDTADISVWAMDAENNPVVGAKVSLSLVAGPTGDRSNWGSVGSVVTTGSNGSGNVSYVAGLEPGTVGIRAEVRTLDSLTVVTSTTYSIELENAVSMSQESQVASIIVSSDKSIMELGLFNKADLIAMATDSQGRVLTNLDFDIAIVAASAVSGAVSVGSVVPEEASGLAKFSYYAGSATGTITISVSAGPVTEYIQLALVENLDSSTAVQELKQLSVQYLLLTSDVYSLGAASRGTARIRATTIDDSSIPQSEVRIDYEIVSGPGGAANRAYWGTIQSPQTTNENGDAESMYVAGEVTGTVQIRASVKSLLTGATVTTATLDIELEQSDLDRELADAAFIVVTSSLQTVITANAPPVYVDNIDGFYLTEVPEDKKQAVISATVVNTSGHVLGLIPVTIRMLDGPGGATNQTNWGSVSPATMNKIGGVNVATYVPGNSPGSALFEVSTGAITGTISLIVSDVWQPEGGELEAEQVQQNVEYLLLDAASSTVPRGGNPVEFVATAMDAMNTRVDDVKVTFRILSHSGLVGQQELWGSLSNPSVTNEGQTTSVYSPSDVSGTVTIEATVRSLFDSTSIIAVTTETISVVDDSVTIPGPVASIVLNSDTLVIEKGLTNSINILAAPVDSAGRLLVGTSVYFRIVNGPTVFTQNWGLIQGAAVLSGAAAYVSVPYFAAAETGTVEIEVMAGAVTRTVTVQVIEPQPETTNVPMEDGYIAVSSNRSIVARGMENIITLDVVAFGENNQPVASNTAINARIVSHSTTTDRAKWGMLVPSGGVDAQGRMTIDYYAATQTGTVVIEVYSGVITGQISIGVVENEPTFLGIVVTPGSLDADGSSQAEIIVSALDIYGDPVPDGTRIDLTLGYASLGFLSTSVLETSNGSATAQYTAPISGGVDGTQTITATLGSVSSARTIQIVDLRVTTIGVLAQPQTLELGQQGYVLATLRDVLGQPVQAGTAVTFAASSTHITLLNDFAASEIDGSATISVVAGFVGTVEVTAYVYGVAGLMTDSTILSIQPPESGTISYVSATPSVVGVRGASSFGNGVIQETSIVIFQVQTSFGQPVPDGTVVDFQLDGPLGSELLQLSGTTLNGQVSTTVRSGTVSGTIRVLAEVDFDGTPFFAWSAPIGVQAGPPAYNHMSVYLGSGFDWSISMPGRDSYGEEGKVFGTLADRYGNPVPEGTQVYFTTEAGIVQANVSTDSLGRVTANYLTANPQPQYLGTFIDNSTYEAHGVLSAGAYPGYSHVVSASVNSINNIMMVAIGEESFVDQNGNGIYDTGEPFTDLSEPYLDTNSDGKRNMDRNYLDDNAASINVPDEPFWDYDQDGQFDGPNGAWNDRSFVWHSANQIWFGDLANVSVLPSRFVDVDSDSLYTDGTDLPVLGGLNPADVTLCTGSVVAEPIVSFTGGFQLLVDFVAEDANGMVPGGWGTNAAMGLGFDGVDFADASLKYDANVVRTVLDAFSERNRISLMHSETKAASGIYSFNYIVRTYTGRIVRTNINVCVID